MHRLGCGNRTEGIVAGVLLPHLGGARRKRWRAAQAVARGASGGNQARD